jgi:hypothetical protein
MVERPTACCYFDVGDVGFDVLQPGRIEHGFTIVLGCVKFTLGLS